MKVEVRIEFEPNEAEAVKEIANVFRELTRHVKLVRANGTAVATPHAPATTYGTAPAPAPIPVAPQPAPVSQSSQGAQLPVATREPQPPPPSPPSFSSLLAAYTAASLKEDQDAVTEAQQQVVAAVLFRQPGEDDAARLKQFQTALEEALFKNGPNDASHVAALCHILPQLPDVIKDECKKLLINQVMKHLMIKRPVTVDRNEFFAHAAAFAALVQLELVLVPGAMQTIIQLLKKEETSCAAVTMLGKTVELCFAQLQHRCEAEILQNLRAALLKVDNEVFQYDKQYIMDTMGWDQTPQEPRLQESIMGGQPNGSSSQVPSHANSSSLPSLVPEATWDAFGAPIKALAIDVARNQIIIVVHIGPLLLYTLEGHELYRTEIPGLFFTDMDYSPKANMLALTAQPKEVGSGSAMFYTYQVEQGRLSPLGRALCQHEDAQLANLRFLVDTKNFIVAEKRANLIDVIDAQTLTGATEAMVASPISVLQVPQSMITCLLPIPTSSRAFLSADRTGTVFLWDSHKPEPRASLLPPPLDETRKEASAGVVTCLEVLGHLVLAGAYAQGITIWDLRGLKETKQLQCCETVSFGDSIVTRLLRGPGERQAVVAAVENISTIELDEDGRLLGKVDSKSSSAKFYFDIKWSTANGHKLYAASAGNTVDIYRTTA